MDEIKVKSNINLLPGMNVSNIALGTVKIGRNKKLKYSSEFELPTLAQTQHLFEVAHELGINLIDTAPAYGEAEEKIGKMPKELRDKFYFITKVGEQFDNSTGVSEYNFSKEAIEKSVVNSLKLLKLESLPAVLVHCDRNDLDCLKNSDIIETLNKLKQKGDIQYFGASTTSLAGGLFAAENLDIVMVSYNAEYQDELPAIKKALELNKGVILKKVLMNGNIRNINELFNSVYENCPNSVMVLGTINPNHLIENVKASL